MIITRSQLRRIIAETVGGPLPMDMLRRTGGYIPAQPVSFFTAIRDGLTQLGPDAESTFAMLVLDLAVSADELAGNFPSLSSPITTADRQTLIDVAESL
jgi:hypothetical protein